MQSILQWNCRGLRTSALELQALVRQQRPLAVCIQETKLKPDSFFSMKGYSVFRKDLTVNTIAHGGVLLAVNHSVPVRRLVVRSPLQVVAARLSLSHREISICSIYLPPGVALPRAELRQLMLELPPPVLLLGDFNSHHSVWGCDTTCSRGRLLASFLDDESLCVLNTGSPTHFTMPSGHTSVLDLSITSPQLMPLFTWRADADAMGSDHFPVWLKYSGQVSLGCRPPRWNLRKADWSEFEERTAQAFPTNTEDNLSVSELTSKLIEAAEGCIPRTSGMPRRAPVPWWSDSCRDAILARKRAYRAFRRNSTTSNMIAFKRARALARRTIKEAKQSSWRSYVSQLNRFTPISEVWSRIKRIAGSSSSVPLPVLRVGGSDITHPAQVANEIGRALRDRSQGDGSDVTFARHRARCEAVGVNFYSTEHFSYNDSFTMPELKSALGTLRSVAEGPDTVHNEMLRHLPPPALSALLILFNSLWERGIYPDEWREAIIIPLLKQGKSGLEPLHYRPIALTSSLGKLMEKMVNVRLTWFLERHEVFTNAQCGFRKHRSTIDHILTLDTEVRASFKQGRHVGALFFDIEAAYDTTWRLGILLKLYKYGIRGSMGAFLSTFLSDRFFRVRVGNQLSERFPQVNGVPQGGVLSVALFAVMINDIGDHLSPAISRALFVDDFSIWSSGASTRVVERQLQMAVTRLERWSAVNGLKFSTAKTVAVHFCRRRRVCPDMSVKLHGEPIPVQPEVKFLGMTMDSRLTYKSHLKLLRDRCFKALNILKCVARTYYGADRSTLLLLYRSLVRSRIDYGCFIYDNASDSAKRTLDTVHHTALRIATGSFRTTPVVSLLAEAHEPSLAFRRQLLGMRYALKLRQFPTHPTYQAVFSRATLSVLGSREGARRVSSVPFCVRMRTLFTESDLQPREIMRVDCLPVPPWHLVTPSVDVSLSETKKDDVSPELFKARALEHIDSYTNHISAYTDGSKTDEGVGCAFVCGDTTRSFTLPSHASVYTSELIAINKLLCYIQVESGMSYLILSDSLSSLLTISSFYPCSPIAQEILQRLTDLDRAGKHVTICWIPSHVGIAGNERADVAAKRAAQRTCLRRLPLPAGDLYPAVASFLFGRWQHTWSNQQGNKLVAIKPKLSPWQSSSRKCRREEVILCRLRTGHTYATHGYLLCGAERPVCPRCQCSLSVKHVLVDCPHLEGERRKHFGVTSSQLTLKNLLCNDSIHIDTKALFVFITAIDLPVIYPFC